MLLINCVQQFAVCLILLHYHIIYHNQDAWQREMQCLIDEERIQQSESGLTRKKDQFYKSPPQLSQHGQHAVLCVCVVKQVSKLDEYYGFCGVEVLSVDCCFTESRFYH